MRLGTTARVAALVMGGFVITAEARTILVDCDAGHTIAGRMLFALPGDTLLVSGICSERVVLGVHRVGLTLQGKPGAEIRAPDSADPAVIIRARGTVLRGFRITGGRHGVSVQDGGHAVIDGNLIESNQDDGVNINEGSSAGLVNNTIRGNGEDGIGISDNSSARIGFLSTQDAAASPNAIDANGRGGVTVSRSANARIAGNSFTGNADYAVRVVRGSQADVAGNTMNDNLGGILVRDNSTAILADAGDGPGAFLTAPNSGVNTQNGVRCRVAGVVSGALGTLTGLGGGVNASTDCTIAITP